MLSKNRNLRQKYTVLLIVFLFLWLGFGAASENAQTKSTKKPAAKKSTPTPTPKKTDRKDSKVTAETSKTSTDKKTAEKKNAEKKDAKSTQKSAAAKSNATKSTSKSSNTKTAEKPNSKTAAKTKEQNARTAAKASKSSTSSAQTKPAKKPVETTAKVTPVKISKPTPKTVVPTESKDLGQAIVIVTSARVRAEPRTGASEVRKMKLGTLLKVVEENPSWYKVEFSNSSKPSSGWMSKQVAGDFSEDNRTEIYRRIVERNYKEEKMSFADAAELYDFLTRAQNELGNSNSAAEIGFKRLLALRAALKAVPFGKAGEKPYADFLKTNGKEVVYSEPSGEWYMRSENLWELHKKYSKEAIAEEIAWAAAQNPLPGECEGYINCYLFFLRETDGEYLTLYPSGKYAGQALKNIQSLIEPIAADLKDKTIYNGPSDVSDRAEFNRLIAELRTIVSKLPFAEIEKQKTIQQLNKIAEGHR